MIANSKYLVPCLKALVVKIRLGGYLLTCYPRSSSSLWKEIRKLKGGHGRTVTTWPIRKVSTWETLVPVI